MSDSRFCDLVEHDPSSFPGFNLEKFMGPLVIGILVATLLSGAACVQAIYYYTSRRDDPRSVLFLVGVVWFIEVFSTALLWGVIYPVSVTGYGTNNFICLGDQWAFKAWFVISGALCTIVQSFFANKIRLLSGQLFIPIACWTISAARFALGLASVITITVRGLFVFESNFKWLVTLVFTFGALVDIILAGTFCWKLSRRRTGAGGTNRVIDLLMKAAIESCVISSAFAISVVICWNIFRTTFYWIALHAVLSKLYPICLIASLNGRKGLRSRLGMGGHRSNRDILQLRRTNHMVPLEVEMHTVTQIFADEKDREPDNGGSQASNDMPKVDSPRAAVILYFHAL